MTQSHAAKLQDDLVHSQGSAEVYQRLGNLTRTLHQALSELGYDKHIATAVDSLPDARTRLAYIAKVSGDSANRTIGCVEKATQVQHALSLQAQDVKAALKSNPAAAIANGVVLQFIEASQQACDQTNVQLTEILMAQDFHDLTGQVINKVVTLAQSLEIQLVQLLLATAPKELAEEAQPSGFLNGPAMNAGQRNDVVQSQAQVDDLLDSLGF
jgi:chemotaxis protein CheZ